MKNLYTAFFAEKNLCIKITNISSSPAENRPIAIEIHKTQGGVKPSPPMPTYDLNHIKLIDLKSRKN